MLINNIKSQQNTNLIDTGYLKLKLTNNLERPLPNVSVKISFSGDPTDTIEQLTTRVFDTCIITYFHPILVFKPFMAYFFCQIFQNNACLFVLVVVK